MSFQNLFDISSVQHFFFLVIFFSVQLQLMDSGAQNNHKSIMKVHCILSFFFYSYKSFVNIELLFTSLKWAGKDLLSQDELEDQISLIL